MRKITELASNALLHGDSFTRDNTGVGGGAMFLHGHKIAEHTLHNTLILNDCGWLTTTTKERLNGVLETFNTGLSIYQKNYTWYIYNHETETSSEWKSGANVITL